MYTEHHQKTRLIPDDTGVYRAQPKITDRYQMTQNITDRYQMTRKYSELESTGETAACPSTKGHYHWPQDKKAVCDVKRS